MHGFHVDYPSLRHITGPTIVRAKFPSYTLICPSYQRIFANIQNCSAFQRLIPSFSGKKGMGKRPLSQDTFCADTTGWWENRGYVGAAERMQQPFSKCSNSQSRNTFYADNRLASSQSRGRDSNPVWSK